MQCVPGERGTFHAHGVFRNARENSQLAQVLFCSSRSPGHQLVKTREKLFRLLARFSFNALCHHRSGRFGDRAAGALEADVADKIAVEIEIDGKVIAAERIEALRLVIRRLDLTIIARRLAVLEDRFLVKLAQVRRQANTSRTFRSPEASASISSCVL